MLKITIPATELWNEEAEEFMNIEEQTLELEHSLVSLSKWESKWCKPFLSSNKSEEETMDYIRCMTLNKEVDDSVFAFIPATEIERINNYIESPMTATWFNNEQRGSRSSEQITSELIYYWMITLNIPFECQNWHLNRLLTLVRVCNVKNQPGKKMGKKAILSQNAAINAARRKQLHSKG